MPGGERRGGCKDGIIRTLRGHRGYAIFHSNRLSIRRRGVAEARLNEDEEDQLQFTVGFKLQGKSGHVIVDAEDALVAALKVKLERPEALITYVRHQNKRGDTRHPGHGLGGESR